MLEEIKVSRLVGRWFLLSVICDISGMFCWPPRSSVMLWGVALFTRREIDRTDYSRQYESWHM